MMRYTILLEEYNRGYKNLKVVFTPNNEVLNVFFSSIPIENFPKLLNCLYKSEIYYQQMISLKFFKNLDWEDINELKKTGDIRINEIVINHELYGSTIINEYLFKQLILDYSKTLVEFYINDLSLSDSWLLEMDNAILNLETKVDEK